MLIFFILLVIFIAGFIYLIYPHDSAYEEMKKRVESDEYKEWLDDLHNNDKDL